MSADITYILTLYLTLMFNIYYVRVPYDSKARTRTLKVIISLKNLRESINLLTLFKRHHCSYLMLLFFDVWIHEYINFSKLSEDYISMYGYMDTCCKNTTVCLLSYILGPGKLWHNCTRLKMSAGSIGGIQGPETTGGRRAQGLCSCARGSAGAPARLTPSLISSQADVHSIYYNIRVLW